MAGPWVGGTGGTGGTDGVEEVEGHLFSVYPNPATDALNVVYKGSDVSTVKVTNISGQVVFEGNIGGTNDKVSIDVSNSSAGIYFVKLILDKQSKIQKLILLK